MANAVRNEGAGDFLYRSHPYQENKEYNQHEKLLAALAAVEFRSAEDVQAIRQNIECIDDELAQIEIKARKEPVSQETSDKICKAVGGLVIVALIATGIVICAIRYS